MVDELRRATEPGKFEGGLVIDQYTYELSLDGCDEECGEFDAMGWYGLIRGPICKAEDSPVGLTGAELAYLKAVAGAIVREESQGFVSVAYYADPQTLEDTWAEIEAECAGADDDGE